MVECMKADPQLFWSIALSVLSVILVIVSIVVSIATLRQNSKMIESSARPYIGVSSLQVNNGSPFFLISVRNYGASAGLINGFSCSKPLGDYCLGDRGLPLFEGIEGTTLMPRQKIVCAMDYKKLRADAIDSLSFTVRYAFGRKKYEDVSVVGVSMNANIVQGRAANEEPLKDISYALQTITEEIA